MPRSLRRFLPFSFALLLGSGGALAGDSVWTESFGRFPSDWASPRQSTAEIRAVFRVEKDSAGSVLHAVHDAFPASGKNIPPAVHFGHAFSTPEVKLANACILRWKWRVLEHPKALPDAWGDLGASVYVVTKNPGLFGDGRGFKFGWLGRSGPGGKKQRGILQIELRHDPATSQLIEERVDLCALYTKHFGAVADEKLLYVGVVTDADNSKSRARADYADFRLSAR